MNAFAMISLDEINHTYLVIGAIALAAFFLLKTAKKIVRRVILIVAVIALAAYFGGLAGLPIPLMN